MDLYQLYNNRGNCRNCKHESPDFVQQCGDVICRYCGYVQEDHIILDVNGTNKYTGSMGEKTQGNGRLGSMKESLNPHASLGSIIPPGFKVSFNVEVTDMDMKGNEITYFVTKYTDLSNIHLKGAKGSNEQTFDRLLKTFRELFDKFDDFTERVQKRIIVYWMKIHNNKKHYRGPLRKGILCNCAYHAFKSIPGATRTKKDVRTMMNVDEYNFNRAENIFHTFCYDAKDLLGDHFTDVRNIFSRMISDLGLKYKDFVPKCISVYEQIYKNDILEGFIQKSIVGGILCFVIDQHPFDEYSEKPKHAAVLKVVGLSNPTVKNVMNVLKKVEFN